MGFLSKIKRKKNTSNAQLVKNNSNDTPPSMGPIDPDGSTASHSSNEIYVTNNNPQQQQSAAMATSQFQNSSDDEVTKKRLSQPKGSKYTQSNTSSLNIRSTQGKNCNTKSRDGVPIITSDGADYFSPSAVSTKKNYAVDGFYSKSKQMFGGKERPKTRPSARTSAFGGAPRYDWMDIVSYCVGLFSYVLGGDLCIVLSMSRLFLTHFLLLILYQFMLHMLIIHI